MPAFLEDLRVTKDGYIWMQSHPDQQKDLPLLPHSKHLWRLLHPHFKEYQLHRHDTDAPPQLAVEDLQRSPSLTETIRNVLSEIEQMKVHKADRSMRLSVNRLKKEQTDRLNQQDVGEEQAYADATLRTTKTLNSIRALFPLLVKMIRHEQMHSTELEIHARDNEGKVTEVVVTLETLAAKKKNRRQRDPGKLAWLLGDYVYDTAKKTHIVNLTDRMCNVLQCFFPESQISTLMDKKKSGSDDEDVWATALAQILENQGSRRITPYPHLLFSPLHHQDQKVQSTAEMCDKEYLHIFHHENREAEHARGLYQQAVNKLVHNLREVLQHQNRGAEVRVYGSCLSNLSLGKSSDVDISLHLPASAFLKKQFASGHIQADRYEREIKNHVHKIGSLLYNKHHSGFRMQECVTRARVPVIKGKYIHAGNPYSPDGSLDFDICFSNEVAVVNSALLSEYTLVDERVKRFLLGIKAWAKNNKVSSAAENGISSYAWVNLGVFYLQCIRFVPNLQSPAFMAQHDFQLDEGSWQNRVNDLDTGYLPWNIVAAKKVWKQPEELSKTPVTLLLYGFFHFYAKQFPRTLFAVSIAQGDISLPRATFEKVILSNLCIEDPFETYCSHCPHDLGRPANESGHEAISHVLVETEGYLRGVLEGGDHAAQDSFWRLVAVAETPQVCANQDVVVPGPHKNPPRQKESHGNRHLGQPKKHPYFSNRAQSLNARPSLQPPPKAKASALPSNQGRGHGRGPRRSVEVHDKNKSDHPSLANQKNKNSDEHAPSNVKVATPPRNQGGPRGSVKANDKSNSADPFKAKQTVKNSVEDAPLNVRVSSASQPNHRATRRLVRAHDTSTPAEDPSNAIQTKKTAVDPSQGGERKHRHSPPRKGRGGGRGQHRSGKDHVNNGVPGDNDVRPVPPVEA